MNESKAQQPRALHFDDLDQIVAEAERLSERGYRMHGHWTLGQVCAHVAILMECSLDGFGFKLPLRYRLLGRLLKKRLLNQPIPAGVRFPARAASTLEPPVVTDGEGLDRLQKAVRRLQAEPQRHPSPLLGRLSNVEWNTFHCRHAALHLGFLEPDPTAPFNRG